MGGSVRPWLCKFYYFPCTSLPRDVHQATHKRTEEPVSPLQDSFSKCERCFVAGSTFKRNKPGKTKYCQGDAHPVLTLWGVKSQSFAFFFCFQYWMACGILVPPPGIKSATPAVEAWSLNHWTTREAPHSSNNELGPPHSGYKVDSKVVLVHILKLALQKKKNIYASYKFV